MILPSGFCLCYAAPQVKDNGEISYMGMDQYSRKWRRLKTYGGKFFEQGTQGSSRDVFAWNMPLVEQHGYPIVTHTHDELITEPEDDDMFGHDELSRLMSTNPSWAEGLPLAAGGFEAFRYRKAD
jgi:DNA polymerase